MADITVFPRDFTSLIGPNNAGKSTILRAIEILLNNITPDVDEWRKNSDGNRVDAPIEIEAEFDELLDWERSKPGVASLVFNDKIRLRRVISVDATLKIDSNIESYSCSEEIEGWDDSWTNLAPEIKTLAQEQITGINGTKFRNKGTQEQVRQLVRDNFSERITIGTPEWSSEGVSIPSALQQALPQAQLIPAVRDAAGDAKPGAKTSFGLLLKKVVLPAITSSDEYRDLLAAVENLDQRLQSTGDDQIPAIRELSEQIAANLRGLMDATVQVGMDPPDTDKFIGSNTILRLDDGTQTPVHLQGHGLQRALVFSLLEILASQNADVTEEGETEAKTRATILLYEEPELFIHPHLMRRLKEALEVISKRADWQVIVSTHSPFIVDVATDPRSLVIHRRPSRSAPPEVTQLQNDPFEGDDNLLDERVRLRAVLDFHPTVCEAFFAQHVVLVEGDSEVALLTNQHELLKLAGIDREVARHVSVVSCAGKWTIVPIARLLTKFGVPVRVVHDMDRKGMGVDELAALPAIHPFRANAKIAEVIGPSGIHAVDDTLEHLLWPVGDAPTSSKDKPFRAWKRALELCEGKKDLSHVPKLAELLRFCFAPFD